jgi:PAS domain S-box-containing protein
MDDQPTVSELERRLAAAETALREKADVEAALRGSEQHFRALFDAIDEGFCVIEVLFDCEGRAEDYRFLQANAAFERQTGLAEAVGKRMRELAPAHEEYWFETYGRIAQTGQAERFESRANALGHWYEVFAFRVGAAAQRQVGILFKDIKQRKLAEIALRESEERQAFLLELSDKLRAAEDPDEIANTALRQLADRLELQGCYILSVRMAEGEADLTHEVRHGKLPSIIGIHRLSGFPETMRRVAKETVVIDDVAADPGLSDLDRQSFAAVGITGGFLAANVRRGEGNPIWAITAASTEPRHWTPGEVRLVEDVAERTWAAIEHARAEASLREGEERFRQFAEAPASAIWIRDATTLAMEYLSPSIFSIYGVKPNVAPDDMRHWAALIVPEDRDSALEHIERARRGESVVHEFRIQRPSDLAFRWIRSTDFPLLDDQGRVQRIGGIAEDITEAKLAVQHQGVLLAELQHRVRNIMAVIHAIAVRTGESAENVAEYASLMTGRLLTLAHVQSLLTRAANLGVGITELVHDELSAQAEHEGQFDASGPEIILSAKAAEILTLAVHELTTNALKYGALSVPSGLIRARWTTIEKDGVPWLSFDWNETGAPERPAQSGPRRRGFGSELIEARIPYELGGSGRVIIEAGGAQCHLEFPLNNAASILETDAPRGATVFGGVLEMTEQADLSGQRVLIVEDDFYIATDIARAVRGAGAEVIGPCPTTASALRELGDTAPTAAMVDINLGSGPSFEIARALKDRRIPFVFVTGYGDEVIPLQFSNTPRLEKPVELRRAINTLAEALGIDSADGDGHYA